MEKLIFWLKFTSAFILLSTSWCGCGDQGYEKGANLKIFNEK